MRMKGMRTEQELCHGKTVHLIRILAMAFLYKAINSALNTMQKGDCTEYPFCAPIGITIRRKRCSVSINTSKNCMTITPRPITDLSFMPKEKTLMNFWMAKDWMHIVHYIITIKQGCLFGKNHWNCGKNHWNFCQAGKWKSHNGSIKTTTLFKPFVKTSPRTIHLILKRS